MATTTENQTTPWRSVDDVLPDWRDAGNVELRRADSSTIAGRLIAGDVGVLGDGDEYPIWTVKLPDGSEASLFDFKEWRRAR